MDRSSKFRSQSNRPICDWSVHDGILSRIQENTRFIRGGSMISKMHKSIGDDEKIVQC